MLAHGKRDTPEAGHERLGWDAGQALLEPKELCVSEEDALVWASEKQA